MPDPLGEVTVGYRTRRQKDDGGVRERPLVLLRKVLRKERHGRVRVELAARERGVQRDGHLVLHEPHDRLQSVDAVTNLALVGVVCVTARQEGERRAPLEACRAPGSRRELTLTLEP